MHTHLLLSSSISVVLGLGCTSGKDDVDRDQNAHDTESDMADITAEDLIDVGEDALVCPPEGPPVIRCPCSNTPGATSYCCTRASNGISGWSCGGLEWAYYQTSCDGDPRLCPQCPLCPVEWEPEWWSPPPGFDPP